MNKLLLSGATLGLLSVVMAAYVDHSLSFKLSVKLLNSVSTAIKYHQLYTLIIIIIGLVSPLQINQRMVFWLTLCAYFFIAGVLLFSFSIYLAAITGMTKIFYLTPIGGVILMIGWCILICIAFLRDR